VARLLSASRSAVNGQSRPSCSRYLATAQNSLALVAFSRLAETVGAQIRQVGRRRSDAGGEWGGLFWATSLEKIFGGVTAIVSYRPGGWMQSAPYRIVS
jgi:hypothetical protein